MKRLLLLIFLACSPLMAQIHTSGTAKSTRADGYFMLFRRCDTPVADTTANGQYTAPCVDSTGHLSIAGTFSADTSAMALETGGNLAALNLAMGLKTDDKSTATNTTSASLIAIEKQISASVQALAALINGGAIPVSGAVSGVNIYNNLFDGAWGINNTAHLYFEGDYTGTNPSSLNNVAVYNNVFIQSAGNLLNNGFVTGYVPDAIWYNNTFIGASVTNSLCAGIYGTRLTFKNNIVSGCTTFVGSGGFTSGGLDNNLYVNLTAGGNYPWVYIGTNESNLTDWRTATGQDGSSPYVSDAGLGSDGHPIVGSPVIGIGANLNSVGISTLNSDKDGNPRPGSGAWDIGAYEYIISGASGSGSRIRLRR